MRPHHNHNEIFFFASLVDSHANTTPTLTPRPLPSHYLIISPITSYQITSTQSIPTRPPQPTRHNPTKHPTPPLIKFKMVKDEDLFALSTPQYWNERYSASRKPDGEGDGQENENEIESYEWYRTFEKLKYFFNKHLPELPAGAGCHILHLGCGHSVCLFIFLFIYFPLLIYFLSSRIQSSPL